MKFRIHTQESAPAASRAALEATATKYGFLPNIFGVLAESPAAAQAYVGITKALEQSVLTPVEQQVVALTVSTANSCTYCVGAHSMVAQMVQMPEQILAELRDQRALSEVKLNALRGLVLSVLYGGGRVSEQDLEQCAAAGFTQRHVLDALTIVALKTLSNAVNHVAHTPLDPQFSQQAWKPESAV